MKTNFLLKLLLGAIMISVLYFLYDSIVSKAVPLNISASLWGLLANFIIASALGLYVSFSTFRGIRLTFFVFLIYFVIGHFNILIEAYIFNVTGRIETAKIMLQGFFITLFFAPILVYILNKWEGASVLLKFKKRSIFSWIWRVSLGTFLYLVFYFSAGMILQMSYPELMDFYKDKIPPFDLMILTQFPRGFLFALTTILILYTSKLSILKKALLVGFIFSILGAIAPLIPANDFMPRNIRFVHGIEVGISNFLYGIVLSYLLRQKNDFTHNELTSKK